MRSRLPWSGWALRAVVFAGPVVALLVGIPQGYTPSPTMTALVAVLSLLFATMPEHYVGSLTIAIVVAWWAVQAGGALPVSALGAAAALLVGHLAGTVAAYGPPALAPDRHVVLIWARRGLALWLVALVTWLVVDAQTGRVSSGWYWVAGLVTALTLVVLATALSPAPGDRRL